MLAHSGAPPPSAAASSVCRGQRPVWPRRRICEPAGVGKASGALIKYKASSRPDVLTHVASAFAATSIGLPIPPFSNRQRPVLAIPFENPRRRVGRSALGMARFVALDDQEKDAA